MRRAVLAATCGIMLAFSGPVHAEAPANGSLRLFGYIEPLLVVEGNLVMEALLDTGADHSSLHAEDIDTFEKEGETWVRFTLIGDDGKRATFERPVERRVRIRGRTEDMARRVVVSMDLCVGDVRRTVDVNLTDRSALRLQALVGRSFLKQGILINPADRRVTRPSCNSVVPE